MADTFIFALSSVLSLLQSISIPYFNITVWQLWIGFMIVSFSIGLLRWILSLNNAPYKREVADRLAYVKYQNRKEKND